MSNRDGSPFDYLMLEYWNDACIASDNISKSNRNKLRATAIAREPLDNHFSHSFGSPHDIRRLYCLICGNEHKFVHMVLDSQSGNVQCAKHVITDCFGGFSFHQRNMLICRCMINEADFILIQYFVNLYRIKDIPHDAQNGLIRKFSFKIDLKFVQTIFIPV